MAVADSFLRLNRQLVRFGERVHFEPKMHLSLMAFFTAAGNFLAFVRVLKYAITE
jgi:hypothetical protein